MQRGAYSDEIGHDLLDETAEDLPRYEHGFAQSASGGITYDEDHEDLQGLSSFSIYRYRASRARTE